jgi:hypothetical protein
MQNTVKQPQVDMVKASHMPPPTILEREVRSAIVHYNVRRYMLLRQIMPQRRTADVTV